MNESQVTAICMTDELYVNGCKVTVRFAQQNNADAMEAIKKILLSNIRPRTA